MFWRAILLLWAAACVHSRPLDAGSLQEDTNSFRRPLAIVSPIEGQTKLHLEQEGLDVLKQLKGPVTPVVVIGPYRSGKSFLLNQLLGVGCDEGFGVGHTRKTQTKGVWMWGSPISLPRGQGEEPLNLLLFDTEGFEATGKADAYDDRIFALSTIISAVLIYNLPETVRESDLQALSFAVQLADTFYQSGQDGGISPVEAASMLWLIQRDFLQGASVQQMVDTALLPVPNIRHDPEIEQVNRIRASLNTIAGNSTAFGLRQPHLERTRLCELQESELEPSYVQQRNDLQQLIRSLSKPKRISGLEVSGPGLADLIHRMVEALNSRDIPTAGSILEHFNRELIQNISDDYKLELEHHELPLEAETLQAIHSKALSAALLRFDKEKFGSEAVASAGSLRSLLEKKMLQIWETRQSANTLTSGAECQDLGALCEDDMEQQQQASLPSIGRFEARFRNDYNSKLFNGLELVFLVDILVFRFFLRSSALETIGWLGFFFLQVYPKLFLSGGSMFDSHWWQVLVHCWENVVYNPVLDLQHIWQLLLLFVVVVAFFWRLWKFCWQRRWWQRKKRKRQKLAGEERERDLGV